MPRTDRTPDGLDQAPSPLVQQVIVEVARACEEYGRQADVSEKSTLRTAVDKLAPHLPGWDPATRTLPWERDDEHYYEHLELPGWYDAGVEVAYRTHCLLWAGPSLAAVADGYIRLCNDVSALVTFHPRYDVDTGTITQDA